MRSILISLCTLAGRLWFTHCVALCLVIVVSSSGESRARDAADRDEAANPAARAISDEARRILNSIKSTQYKHKTDIDEEEGRYHCDCSGFVGYVLNRTVARDDPKGPLGDGKKRPLAMDYEKAFAKANANSNGPRSWQRVARLVEARPGDVIAWRHEKPRPGNTGHVVIVDQRPVVENDRLVRVVIIDSTTKPQVNDTRAKGTSGVGRGTMWFKVDDAGRPIAHVRGSKGATPKTEAISIGRPAPIDTKQAARKAA